MIRALGLALLAAVEPLGVIAFIAVLGSRGGRRNTRGFIVGWVLCACLVGVVTLVLFSQHRARPASPTVASAGLLQIALGVVAIGFLVRRRLRARSGEKAARPATEKEDNLGPFGAGMIAAAFQGWPVVAGAVAAVLESTHDTTGRAFGLAAVALVISSTFVIAHVMAGRRPERTAAWLARLREWIEAHRERAIDLLLLLAGSYLVVHGVIAQLAS